MFNTAFTIARQLSTSSAKWIQFTPSQPISSKFILKLVALLSLAITMVSFLAILEPKSSPHTWHTSPQSHLTLHDLITPNNIRRGVNITKLIIMEFSPLSIYSLHLKTKCLIHRPILDHPRPVRSSEHHRPIETTDQVTTLHSNTLYISLLCIYVFRYDS